MKQKMKRTISFLLTLVCVLGLLPLSAFAASGLSDAPSAITQHNVDYLYVGGRPIRYDTASSIVNSAGSPYLFNVQVSVPGLDQPARALCSYHEGTLGSGANGQRWNYKTEVIHPSLVALLTWVYSCAYGDFTDAGNAAGMPTWEEGWTNVWFMVAQSLTWYNEYGLLIDYNTDREGFIRQVADEFLAAFKVCHDTWNWAQWVTDWDSLDIYSIIDSADNGATGGSAYDFASVAMNRVLDYPEYFHNYRLWEYEWDSTQTWKLPGQQNKPMQRLLIAIPDGNPDIEPAKLTIKKLEAGTNQPLAGVTFKIENTIDPAEFSVIRTTGTDGIITLTSEADNLGIGQYTITEVAAPDGYLKQNDSTTVTILPNSSAEAVFTYYNTPITGTGTIRKVDADNPTVGLPGAVIRITSVKLDEGGSFSGEYITGDGGYISEDDLDFKNLPVGSYIAEEITPPQGYTLSTDPAKVRQTFVWDGVHNVNLVFEDDAKVKIQLKKVDESGNPLAGAVFIILKDGQIIDTGTTNTAGEITVSNVSEGYYEFREVAAPAGFDKDPTPVGVYVNSEDLEGEQTITVTKVNYHKRSLTIEKRDSMTGDTIPGTVFHVRGVNVAFEQDVTTGANGKVTLSSLPSGCYEITEKSVPSPWLLDTNNCRTVWINAEQGQDVTVIFENSTKPGLRILKIDYETGQPLEGVTFLIERISGGYSEQHITDSKGEIFLENLTPGAYKITEVQPAPGYVADDMPRVVNLEENRTTTLELVNVKQPTLKIVKTDAITGAPVQGVTFTVKIADGRTITTEATNALGEIILENLDPGVVEIWEQSVPSNYILDTEHQLITLVPDKLATVQFQNYKRPTLKIAKVDIDGNSLTGAIFTVTTKAGVKIGDFPVGADGTVTISNTQLDEGYYIITEKQAPTGYILDTTPHEVYLRPGQTTEISIENEKKPGLTIHKIDSVVGDGIKGAKFEIWVSKDNSQNGTYQKLDSTYYYTDENGIIHLDNLDTGWYKVVEVEPAAGFTIKEPAEQTIYVQHDKTAEVTFENTPLNAIIVEKYDSVTGAALPGCTFQLRYLGGTSGTGGTVIGQKVTSKNGTAMWTGLQPGTYIIEEVDPADGYSIIQSSETVFLADSGEQSVITVRFENAPDGNLLIRKVCAINPSVTLANAEFKVTYADGSFIGDSNGVYRTDEYGEILITGLKPGKSVVVTETKAPDGFLIDTQSQTIEIKAGKTVSLTFKNQPKGALIIQKRDSATGQPLSGAEFRVTTAAGCEVGLDGVIGTSTLTQNGIFTTDAQGEIKITNLAPGAYVLTELKAPDGYVIDTPSTNVVIGSGGDTQTVVIKNSKAGTLVIDKRDSLTGKPLEGVAFKVTTSTGEFVPAENGQISSNGLYFTDKDGKITINGVVGTLVVTETATIPGYTIDEATRTQTVVVNPNDTQTLYFTNTPSTTLVIEKYIEGTTTPLKGVTFLVTDSSGAVVGQSNGEFITDENGRIVLNDLTPGATITAREVKTLEGYVLDGTPKSILIKEGEVQTLRFYNQQQGTIVIRKLDKVTGKPLAGVEFELTYAEGGYVDSANGHLSSNGLYTTNTNGEIRISGVTGTIVVKETKTIPGYTIDEATRTQTVVVRPADTQTLTFYNAPQQTLTIQKYVDGTTDPIQGVTFLVTDSSGAYVGPNNGIYTTDKNGRIIITGLTPGVTITARETKAADGYVLDTTPQDILIKEGTAQTLTFFNKRIGGLELIKVNEDNKTQRIPNAIFEIRRMDGGLVDTITTNSRGRVYLSLEAGNYYAVEIEAPEGFKLDDSPHYFEVKDGKTTTLTITNKAFSGILIHKTDSVTGKGISGVTFLLYDSTNTPIGQYTSDNRGYVYIENLTVSGRYYLRELENAGYIPDTELKTVYVTAGETTLIEWANTPITGQIQITKKSADYNPINGLPAGTLLEGAIFEIYDKTGNLVDTIRSDSRGLAVSKQLPLDRYTIREVKAPDNYGISGEDLTAYLDYAGQIVRFEVTNKSLTTGVSITKTGPTEIMAGQPVRYVFSGIANNSNVRLDNFYWRDTLPAEVRLNTIVTGTYNFPGTYKIVYRVNGGEYRTLADNLSTSKNYTLAASATALGLASNERVTEIMFIFGQAPAGFAQVETPCLYCTAVSSITSAAFVNIADVGGVYNGKWVQTITRWVTKVYKPIVITLPRTGY